MKKILLLSSLMLVFLNITNAQTQITLSLTPNPHDKIVDLTASETVAHGELTNLASSEKTYHWLRNIISKPTEWQVFVCDPVQCFLPAKNDSEFTMNANVTSNLDVHVRPFGIPGTAQVELRVWEVGNDSNYIIGVYNFTAVTGNEDLLQPEINVFPNPTTKSFAIINDENVKDIEIYNIIGQKVKSFIAISGNIYDVADLEKGIYLVKLLDENKIIKTIRLEKQ